MTRSIVIIIIFLNPLLQFSQDYSALWNGHFSYTKINDISQGNNKLFVASENAIFSLDTQSNEINEITTIKGLSGETISTIYYSEVYELLIIGYENGLIEIVFDDEDDVLTLIDIINKPTIAPNNKKINHFNANQNIIYISTNYGISIFDLERLEFGDTYFIGNGGSQIKVTETTIFNDFIYASCLNGNGIRKAAVADKNLIDFNNWQQIISGNWIAIETQKDNLFALADNKRIYQILDDTINVKFSYSDAPVDLRSENDNLIVTTLNNVYVYNTDFDVVSQVETDINFDTQYTSATIIQDHIYLGTKNFGILKTPILNPVVFEEIHPDGPLLNIPFSIEAEPNGLWVTYGEYTINFNPYPLNRRGMSHLLDGEWINTNYDQLLEAACLNNITINPFKTSQVFISSFFSGILEINEGDPTILFNTTNSELESLVTADPDYIDIRVGASKFDEAGVLWNLTSRVNAPLKSYNPSTNNWNTFSFEDIFTDGNVDFADLIIGNDQTKWIASSNFGIIGFNELNSGTKIRNIQKESDNMPTEYVSALAIDNRNQLWIGTLKGLRILYNTSNFFTEENLAVDEIIIEEDGIAKELLFQQHITDIEVDGANNKWIATSSAGLFYLSSDGQKTIFHFTKNNSPLPSNSIRDVSISKADGVVYIATSKGLLSFKSGSSSVVEGLHSAYAYPNPIRPGFNIIEEKVKIKDISENVNIKITDIEGNLVAEAQSRINQRYQGYNLEIDGGTAYWNGKNLANNVVASGVYLVLLSDLDTFETKVLKLMVVR